MSIDIREPAEDDPARFVATLSYSPEEMRHLGFDPGLILDRADSALEALHALRAGRSIKRHDYHTWITHVRTLAAQMISLRDALMVAHARDGGSLSRLGDALDVPRSTAQSRLAAVLRREPLPWDKWVTAGPQPPQNNERTEIRPESN